jgi:fatty acid desaturase
MGNQVDIKRVRELVSDLRTPRPGIYFADLILCASFGWGAFVVALQDGPSALRLLALTMAVFLLYRTLAFIHEIFHQQAMTGFRMLWHAVSGGPLLLPFLLYLPIHQAHHNSKTYGTKNDGEYDQFKGRFAAASTKLFLLNLAMPLALWVRFAVLTPLTVVFPPIRDKVIPEFVHMALRLPYRAPAIKESARAEAMTVEWWCFAYAWGWVALGGLLGWHIVAAWVLLVIAIATLNTIRTLGGTHLYVEKTEGRGTRGQLLDSLNVDSRTPLTLLLCPVGLRFHALHHVAPYLPYHALPAAHSRLKKQLSASSEYHQVTVRSVSEGITRLRKATAS